MEKRINGETAITIHTLVNANGLEATVLDYGGIIQSLRVPDRDGRFDDIVLGFDDPARYRDPHPHLGALIGRVAGRIANARFTLDGRTYELAANHGRNHLHGGEGGFDAVVWEVGEPEGDDGASLVLRHTSPSGEEGYPGTLEATVTYTLTDADELAIDYHATTDAPTPVNLTQHSYFNLAGHDAGDVLGHVVEIDADGYLPTDAELIPTGDIEAVAGTPLDFRSPEAIGARIDDDHPSLRHGRGYDLAYALNGPRGGADAPRHAARAREPGSGRVLEVLTTEPGLVFYTANYIDGLEGKGGAVYGPRSGFCLEAQRFPDSPNQPSFPSVILRPGETYHARTVYRFAADA